MGDLLTGPESGHLDSQLPPLQHHRLCICPPTPGLHQQVQRGPSMAACACEEAGLVETNSRLFTVLYCELLKDESLDRVSVKN